MSEVEGVVLATLSFLVFIIPAITYFVIISRPKRQEPLNSVQSRPIQPPLPQMKRNLSPNKNMRSVNSSSSHLPMSQRTIPDFGFFTNSKHSTPAASRLHLNEVGSNRLQTAASVTSSITRLFHQVPQVLISFSNLSYSVYDKKNVETKILDNISGFIKPYSLCAFMGPSGSGKTTLLDILAGRRNTGKILGTIQINGLRRNISTFKDISAYVMQDDLLFSYLTVRETLLFTADLKLASPTERITKVDKVISELNLTSLANTRIGNERIGGLTRGQKRRLTVAIELITSPSVLFLDEPTSGLDAYSSLNLIKLLKKLAHRGGRTIICTIHQPNAQIFELFDQLYMIVKGKTAYFGPTDKINSYFKTIGITIPLKTNTADFIVDLTQDNKENAVTMFDNSPKKKITSAQTDSVKSLSFEKIKSVSNDLVVTDLESSPPPSRKTSLQKRPDVKIQIRDTKTRITSTIRDLPPISSQFHGIFQAKPSDSFNKTIDVVNLPEKYLKSTLYKDAMEELGLIENNSHPIIISLAIDSHEISVTEKTTTLIHRTFINNIRNSGFFISWLVGGISFLFYGLIYVGMPKTNDLAYFDSQRAFLFQIQTAIVFLQLETLTSSHADSKIFHREFASASYSAFSYHLAWFVKSATYSLLRGVVFTPLVYFLSGLTLSFMQYFIFMTVFCLMDLIGASLSLLLVSGIQKLETSSVLFTLTNSLAATSCGYFLRPQFIQVWFYWLFHSSWFKYGLNAMYINEFEDEDVLTNIFGVDQLNLFENVIILFIYPIVFNIGAYFSSCWLARPRKE